MITPTPANHPNASTAGGTSIFAAFIVWAAGHFGIVDLGAEEAVVVAGVLTTVALFIGRRGVVGIWNVVKHGTGTLLR